MDKKSGSESEGRSEPEGSRLLQNQVWEEGQSEAASERWGRHAREAEKKGFFLNADGVSQRPTEGREGASYEVEEITGRMGSLW